MVNQERLAIVRALPIGPARYLHLENAEVDPELQFLPPVQPDNLAHFDRPSFMRPILEQRIEIKTHDVNNVRNSASLCQSPLRNESDSYSLDERAGSPFAKSLAPHFHLSLAPHRSSLNP